MEDEWTTTEWNNWDSKTISVCLEPGVGGKQVHLVTVDSIKDKV